MELNFLSVPRFNNSSSCYEGVDFFLVKSTSAAAVHAGQQDEPVGNIEFRAVADRMSSRAHLCGARRSPKKSICLTSVHTTSQTAVGNDVDSFNSEDLSFISCDSFGAYGDLSAPSRVVAGQACIRRTRSDLSCFSPGERASFFVCCPPVCVSRSCAAHFSERQDEASGCASESPEGSSCQSEQTSAARDSLFLSVSDYPDSSHLHRANVAVRLHQGASESVTLPQPLRASMSGFRADLSMLCPPFFCSSVVARVHRKSLEPGRVQFTSGAPRTPQAQQPIDAWAAGIWRIAPSFWGRSLEKLPALPFLNFFSQQRSRTPGTSLARSVTKPSLSVCGLPGFCETRMRSGLLLVSSVVGSARTFILLFLVFFLTGLRANLAPSGGKAPSISCLCALSYSIRTGATTRRAAASFSPFSASSRWGSRESTGRRDTRVFSLSSRDFHTQRRKGERSQGAAKMDSFLRPLQPKKSLFQVLQKGPLRVSLVGSGNWGSVIGKIVAQNAERSYVFHNEVRMWVFEEMVGGEKLTDIINRKHENVRYLPGYKLPENLVAVPDVVEACRDSDLLVFVMPHQFVARVCDQIAKARVVPAHARAISLLKGLHVEGGRPHLFSEMIRSRLNIVECAALSGANVANDVAREEFAEATIGHSPDETDTALIWQQLFDKPYLKVNALPDVAGVQVCGAVKNVVALAAGFCDGLGLGTNAKSAIIRLGVEEMKQFGMLFFDNVIAETFFDSAGYADVITTVFGGRNARCAAEFVRQKGKKSWDEIEAEMLNGQKLQGTLTTREVFDVISSHEVDHLFPLFAVTYEIAFKGRDPADLIRVFETKDLRAHKTPEECNMLVLPPLMSSARTRINRLQSMVDHERFRDEEKKIVKEYERRYTQIEGVGDVTARGGSQ